ncbi:PTS sugar transporter subunit IIA [Atopobium fossor]|uniref:PTS sugar transporter subunit IIA n=1 Tax=Atopobium fossor TaxID=39487 RepID=UPI000423DE3B|nr:PTS sugar transporter subunit IIA [Atopobium fossor]
MRHLVLASHAHFAQGIAESLELLAGHPCELHTINAFVDGATDVVEQITELLTAIPSEDEIVVATDLLGGSVNNEFLNRIQNQTNIHLVANMNLPMLLTLALSINDVPNLQQFLRELVADPDITPKYCNDLLASTSEDDDF